MAKKPLTPEEIALKEAAKVAKKAADGAISTLAASYGLVPAEKRALLRQADRLHLTEQAAEVVLTRLVPKALAVWEQALDSGNVDVATRVLEGAAIVGRIMEWKKPAESSGDAFDFELVRERIIGRVTAGATREDSPGGGEPTPGAYPAITAEVIRSGSGSNNTPDRDGAVVSDPRRVD